MLLKEFPIFSFFLLLPKGTFPSISGCNTAARAIAKTSAMFCLWQSCPGAAMNPQTGQSCRHTLYMRRPWLDAFKIQAAPAACHSSPTSCDSQNLADPFLHGRKPLLYPAVRLSHLHHKTCLQSTSSPLKVLDSGHTLSLRNGQPWESKLHKRPGHQGLWKTL